MVDTLFWAALVLSGVCVLVFSALALISVWRQGSASEGAAEGAEPESGDIISAITDGLSKVTGEFAKSGPIPTAATLSVFFMLVALVASGFLTIGTPE